MSFTILAQGRDNAKFDDARRLLGHSKVHGLDVTVLNLYGLDGARFPEHNRTLLEAALLRKGEYKSQNESTQDYISRLVRTGLGVESNGNLYVIKGNIGLIFGIEGERVIDSEEEVTFFRRGDAFLGMLLEDIVDVVTVRGCDMDIRYSGWDKLKNLKLSEQMRNIFDKGYVIPNFID